MSTRQKQDELRARAFRSGWTTAIECLEQGLTLEDLKRSSFYEVGSLIPQPRPDSDEDDDVDDEAWDP